VVFVADALGGWLVGQLADAGRKKLTELVLGSEQERALRRAADVAVWATAEEVSHSGGEHAGQVARVISEVFRDPVPAAQPAGPVMLLEGLQAGIARQLAVLDDAGLTGTGQSSADVMGVPGAVLADRLTGHLVREIIVRGSGGGPLAPLADQFNHELTRLQIGGMLAQLAAEVRVALARPGTGATVAGRPLEEVTDPFVLEVPGATVAGRPLEEVTDPFVLEVHRPVEPDLPQPELLVLPVYMPRDHDAALAEVVTAAAAGTSGIAVLVGGSSTGKTRACWQALELLRGLEPGWRLWHPIDPQGALADMAGAGPRTVVWLNEAQRYFDTTDGAGERVAAGLRTLLRDPTRGPVLVLATLWQEFWDDLTARPPGGADPHAQARELMTGRDIVVPAAFTPAQLQQLEEAGDPRLAQAAAGSRDGQVIQYLAGAPDLLDRYHHAPPAARALIDAAMDARRLGMRPAVPRAFLEAAAPGYLTDADWDLLPPDWLEEALGYTGKPAKGVRGPLAPIRPRPTAGGPASSGDGPALQLADYLDQHGRRARYGLIPPGAFWEAAVRYADPADLASLGEAAENRGLSREAARLYKQATTHGDARAGIHLVRLLHGLQPGDPRPADWAAAHASLGDPPAVADLLDELREVRAATALADRAAAHASLDDPYGVSRLLGMLEQVGAVDQRDRLLDRDPAAHVSLDNLQTVGWLLDALRLVGATGQVTVLASRAAAHASLDHPAMGMLLGVLREVGATGQVTALASRAAAHASLDDPEAVAQLLGALQRVGAVDQRDRLLDRDPAAHASLDDPLAVASVLRALREAGASGQIHALLARNPARHVSLEHPVFVASLLRALREVGATAQVTALATRAAAHASLDNPIDVASLLEALREVGATGQVTALATRAAAHASLDNPATVASLLEALREAGATGQITALLDRDPAAHASLDNPGAVASLLRALRKAGATGQITALLDRDPAAHASLDNSVTVARLLEALRAVEASVQAAALIKRLPAAGQFQLFCRQEGRESEFRFGREADGSPAKQWTWTDLG
jgi:hypothetical protein